MALTNAEKQARWRERRNALARSNAEAAERALLEEVERCRRGELSDQERIALADQLADKANGHLWRAHELAQMARNVRTGNLQRA